MDLQTAKLVAFAIYTEDGAGIMGVAPIDLEHRWTLINRCGIVEDVLECLPIDLQWKWENYWGIWSKEAEEGAKSPEDDRIILTEKGEAALEEVKGAALPRTTTLTPKGEAAAEAAELEIHAEVEAKNLEGSQPPAVKRGSKKGR